MGGERKHTMTPCEENNVRHNGKPPVLASSISPNLLNLRPGEHPAAACPDCGAWRTLRRGMLWPHRTDDGITRCPGSGQRIVIDLTAAHWLTTLDIACRDAATRRTIRPHAKPEPPVLMPVYRLTTA
ncbi:hypothetical protein J5X84_02290 [Streptosporangiaceae bacterium NEAU-GS5]|nr:hypothetical protein [Streptosporangiaceae bacterium NEAU-GS5]